MIMHPTPVAAAPIAHAAAQSAGPGAGPAGPSTAPTFWIPDSGSGWIDFEPTERGQIVIPVVLDGAPARALIDTGFDQMALSKAFAVAHHLPLRPWTVSKSFGGLTPLYVTPDVTLDIGAVRTTKAGDYTVVDLASLSQADLGPVDAVIALPLLGAVAWEVDQDHHRVRFLKSGSVAIPDGIAVRAGPGHSRLVADIAVDGHPVTPAMIDTGADAEVSLPLFTAQALDFRGQTDMAAAGAGGVVVQAIGRLRDFRIGTRALPGAYASIDTNDWFAGPAIKALVGMGVLQRYNMIVDLGAGKMQLTPRAVPIPPSPKSTSGVQGPYRNGRLTIVHVMKGSPAAAAGLTDGDAICAIDGKPMSQEMVDRHWGRAAAGTRYTLTLCDGATRTIVLRDFY